jgi:hypothetical protein
MLSSAAILSACVESWIEGTPRTFDELATVDLAGCNLEGDNVALSAISTRAEQRPGLNIQPPRSGA